MKKSQDIPVCAIVLKKDSKINEPQLMQYAKEHLASYRPQLILSLNKIPRNKEGKIVKKELQNLVLNHLKDRKK